MLCNLQQDTEGNRWTGTRPDPALSSQEPQVENQPKRILVLDDEPGILEVLEVYLKSQNFEAFINSQWTEAVDLIFHNPPNLILLDLKMPTIQGDKVLEFVRQQSSTLPVIVVSAHLTEKMMQDLRRLVAKGFAPKPFKFDKLMAIINAALKHSLASSP